MTANQGPLDDERGRTPIVVDHVTRSHRRGPERILAVDDVSFELRPGELTGLVGPSGSGKTTLVNVVIGADHAESGLVTGIPSPISWERLAIVPQQLGLLDELTLRENVELPGRRHRRTHRFDPTTEAAERLAELGLADVADRRPSQTSLGQQQRAAIARAVVGRPDVLVADEPTSHQDEANVSLIADVLSASATSGAIVFVATHDQRLVDRCDAIIEMRNGRRTDR